MKANLQNESGSALLISMVLMLMVGAIAAVALTRATTDIDLSYNQVHEEQAFYVAEAGAKMALAQLRDDDTWRDGYSQVELGGGLYDVRLEDSTDLATLGDTILIVATGAVDGTESMIALWVVPAETHPFVNGMFGRSLVDIRNSLSTDSYNSDSGTYAATYVNTGGDVGSNEDIIVHNGAVIGGDVTTATEGALDINWGATITGNTTDQADEQDFPPITDEEYAWAESVSQASSGITGSYTYDPVTHSFETDGTVELSDGVYYFSDITLKHAAELTIAPGANVTIYVTGDIELKNSSSMNSGGDAGDLVILSRGDFVLKNSGEIAAVFYNPDGSADLRNSGDFFGAIVADDIVAHNSAFFHYDRALANFAFESNGEFDVAGWEELL